MKNFSVGKFNEDLFNASFRPEYKALILKELENQPAEKKSIIKDIIFKHEFDKEFKEDIKRLLDILLDFAVDIGLCGQINLIRVIFIRHSFWKLSNLSQKEQIKSLPAIKLLNYRNEPAYMMILRDGENTPSDLMNIIRLLFSKIFGEIFFKNQIENKSPFNELLRKPDQTVFSENEKIAVARTYFDENTELRTLWKSIGEEKKLKGEKGIAYGKSLFFRRLEKKESNYADFEKILDKTIRQYSENAIQFYKNQQGSPLRKIYEINKILYFIMPHEVYKFRQLEKQPAVFFSILSEKSKYLRSVFLQLKSLNDASASSSQSTQLEDDNFPGSDKENHTAEKDNSHISIENTNDIDTQISLYGSICRGLIDKDLAKEFLLPEAFLSKTQIIEQKKFLFKIYREFSEYEDKQIDLRTAEKIQQNYSNCLSQRIYNICSLKILELNEKRLGNVHLKISDAVKININWIDFRYTYLSDMCDVARYFERFFKRYDPFPEKVRLSLRIAETGWSYFISSALLYVYYEIFAAEKIEGSKKKDQFLNIIQEHINKNMDSTEYFRFAALYLHLFRKFNFNLGKMIKVIHFRCPVLISIIREGVFSNKVPSSEYLESSWVSVKNWLELLEEGNTVSAAKN